MTPGIFELALVVLAAAGLGVLAKLLRQPLILAYLATGLLIGAFGFTHLVAQDTFRVFSNLGIMFLLFLVGLEINYTSLRLVGKVSVIVGVGQILFTALIGYFIAAALGFAPLPALYLAVVLTFSSTIIVVKLLSDKKDLQSLYGKISVGFLLVQDFVAILILIILAGLGSGEGVGAGGVLLTVGKGVGLFLLMLWLGRRVLPKVFDRVAQSEELLFLVSVAWLFLIAAAVSKIGFSIEIAGFLAGIALANSSEHFQIASRVTPLRDFFILIFFVILGSSIAAANLSGLTWPIVAFSLFVLIGNPLIVLIIMGLMGYRKRTSFFAGVTVAQISEFSLILIALGFRLGHVTEGVVALVTAVGVITILVSTYLITHADRVYPKLARALSFFERRTNKEFDLPPAGFHRPVVLVGAHRTGESIAMSLPREEVLVVDFDPEVIKRMERRGFQCLFGDVRDREIFDLANVKEAKLLVSTSPDLEDNLTLLSELKGSPGPRTVLRAETEEEAEMLYARGADYVLLPHLTAGQYLGKTIAIDPAMRVLEELKEKDLELLKRIHE